MQIRIVEFISLHEALTEMETLVSNEPRRFNIIACTYDNERNTGGKVLILNNVKLAHLNNAKKSVPDEFLRKQDYEAKRTANPHHKENSTKNFALPNGEVRKCNIHFILFYNNKQIIQ